jgi:hypothetical protein
LPRPAREQIVTTRRQFLVRSAGLAAVGCLADAAIGAETSPARPAPRRVRYLGWQVGVTYQAPGPAGLTRDDMLRLLDEMAGAGMNLLSLMMISYAFFDPRHDGYAWPVRNPRLKCYWDRESVNGRPESEFVGRLIEAAAARQVEIQLMMNWGIWNPQRIRQGYPTAGLQQLRPEREDGARRHWLHCPDSPGAWQAGLDEAEDLLRTYNHPNVKSFSLERLSYGGGGAYCFCRDTQQAFERETGRPMLRAAPKAIEAWRNDRIGGLLKRYVDHVRSVRPGIEVALHTQCAPGWGHRPDRLPDCGIDYLMPHSFQFPETRDSFHRMLDRLAPNRCVLHFCSRDRRPANYDLWIKTPEIIAQGVRWAMDYPDRDRIQGIVFFNPNATSAENRKAVYQQVKQFAL